MIKKKCFGFTLAEVLTTIGIIGIVAALTIPHLNLNGTKFEDIDKAEYGNPCSVNSKQKNNGYGCSWYALHNQNPDNTAESYWTNLAKTTR